LLRQITLRYPALVKPQDVRRIRRRLGLTQLQYAALLGVHEKTVTRWESGTLGMSGTTQRLIQSLGEKGVGILKRERTRPVKLRKRRRP
jgi:DNA-binding transcriptional regulator YiaG